MGAPILHQPEIAMISRRTEFSRTTGFSDNGQAERDFGLVRRYRICMVTRTTDELLAAIRRLPLNERLQLIQRAARDAAEDTPRPTEVRESPPSLIGLMSDDPDLVDQVCALAYEVRTSARMRKVDE
jgi:hypothetical protein